MKIEFQCKNKTFLFRLFIYLLNSFFFESIEEEGKREKFPEKFDKHFLHFHFFINKQEIVQQKKKKFKNLFDI